MRVAFTYDRINKIGGAERVLEALHELWPDAPVFTSVYDEKGAPWAKKFHVIPSFLQYVPFASTHHEFFPWLTPFAFESFNFDSYDVVISITSAESKDIVTKPETLHICYCLTPTRYLWSGEEAYKKRGGFGVFEAMAQWVYRAMLPTLKAWDLSASEKPDMYIAISEHVKKRIRLYYGKESDAVIYPPVETDVFFSKHTTKKEYYLFVGRLVPYKRADIVISACNALQKQLIVVGEGSEKRQLQKIAGPTITFVDHRLTDKELLRYYENCRAFLYAGEEDFGIVACEAQSCGKPVIAYRNSGISEIVRDGETGILFDEQSITSLTSAIVKSETMQFSSKACTINAERFGKEVFKKQCWNFVKNAYNHQL